MTDLSPTTAFWRVSWRAEGSRKRSWQYGDRLAVHGPVLTFRALDRDGLPLAPKDAEGSPHDGEGDVTHVVDLGLDVRRVPLHLDRTLGEYVPGGPEERIGLGFVVAPVAPRG